MQHRGGAAVAQDWLAAEAGSERVTLELSRLLPDAEIYTALRECDMDPDEAANRLLSQGPIPCHSPFPHHFVCNFCLMYWLELH